MTRYVLAVLDAWEVYGELARRDLLWPGATVAELAVHYYWDLAPCRA